MVVEFTRKRQQAHAVRELQGGTLMGYEAKKTEHCGPKRGEGAYWGYKWEAKKESNRIRRENAMREIRDASNEDDRHLAVEAIPGNSDV
jgi:hypothetical protein